ncbi:MAG: hypothetical protein LC624_05665 [Halobacteriales archaeon]|nr:hypothetical protein [Halobacteriales archaeon]
MPLLLAPCPRCGRDAPTGIRAGPTLPRIEEVVVRCPACAAESRVPGSTLRRA